MKVNESYIAWLPNTDYVEVLPLGEEPKTKGAWTGLGAYAHIQEADSKDRKMMTFISAMHLIIRDKVDPMAVHKALMQLEEYRAGCAPDMPGMAKYLPREGEA